MKNKEKKEKKPGKKMNKYLKRFLIFIIVMAVIVVGLVITRRVRSKANTQNVTYTVNKETYENVIEISGVVSAAKSQNLQALSSGTVVGVYVKQGDHVKKGDVIGKIAETGTFEKHKGPHLHLEVWNKDGDRTDPAQFFESSDK